MMHHHYQLLSSNDLDASHLHPHAAVSDLRVQEGRCKKGGACCMYFYLRCGGGTFVYNSIYLHCYCCFWSFFTMTLLGTSPS